MVPDAKHLAVRRLMYNREELIPNEGENLEGKGREFLQQNKW